MIPTPNPTPTLAPPKRYQNAAKCLNEHRMKCTPSIIPLHSLPCQKKTKKKPLHVLYIQLDIYPYTSPSIYLSLSLPITIHLHLSDHKSRFPLLDLAEFSVTP